MPAELSPVALLHEHENGPMQEVVIESDGQTRCGRCGARVEGLGLIERRITSFTITEK